MNSSSRNLKSHGVRKAPLGQSILVIDDSSDALAVQRLLLELEGFEVITAESGMKALEILSSAFEPNLILLDMLMEDMSGVEFLGLLEKMRPEILKDVPVVFLTGMDVIPNSKAVGVIRKPADRDKFLKDVHRFIKMGYCEPYEH